MRLLASVLLLSLSMTSAQTVPKTTAPVQHAPSDTADLSPAAPVTNSGLASVLYATYDSKMNRMIVMLDRKSRDRNLNRLARSSTTPALSITLTASKPHDADPAYNGTYTAQLAAGGHEIIYTPTTAPSSGSFASGGMISYAVIQSASPTTSKRSVPKQRIGGRLADCPDCTGTLSLTQDIGDDEIGTTAWILDAATGTALTVDGGDNEPNILLSTEPGITSYSTDIDAAEGITFTSSGLPICPFCVDGSPGIAFNNGGFINETTGISSNVVTGTLTYPGDFFAERYQCPTGAIIWNSVDTGDVTCDNNLNYNQSLANITSQLIGGFPYADQFQYPPETGLNGIGNMTSGFFSLGPQYQGNMGTVDPNYPFFYNYSGIDSIYDLSGITVTGNGTLTLTDFTLAPGATASAPVVSGIIGTVTVVNPGYEPMPGIATVTASCDTCTITSITPVTADITVRGYPVPIGSYEEYNGASFNIGNDPAPCYGLSSSSVVGDFCDYQWTLNTHFTDQRDGTTYENYYDPINRFGGLIAPSATTNNRSSVVGSARIDIANYDLDYGNSNLQAFARIQHQYAGGHNGNYAINLLPNSPTSGWAKTTTVESLDQAFDWSLGQHTLNHSVQYCMGLGDCLGNQTSITYSVGKSAPSDIGITPDNLQIGESTQVFTGVCSACSSGATLLLTTPTYGSNGQQGEGRMAIDLTAAIPYNGIVTSGAYTGSGITAIGTTGQYCNLTTFNNGSSATAQVWLTSTNFVGSQPLTGALGAPLSGGSGALAPPTQAVASNGTATCSGTASITTTISAGLIVGESNPPGSLSTYIAPTNTFTPSSAIGSIATAIIAAPGQGQPGQSGSGTEYTVPLRTTTGTFASGILCITDSQSAEQVLATISDAGSGAATGNLINGSATVADLMNAASVTVGDIIVGSGIPADTTVVSISGTTLVMSEAATVTASGVSLAFPLISGIYRYPHLSGAILAQNGTCGLGMEIVVDTQQMTSGNPSNTIRTLIPLYGSPDTMTTYGNLVPTAAVYAQRLTGMTFTANSTGTRVTVTGGNFGFEETGGLGGYSTAANFGNIDGQQVTIQGCSSPGLNGTFTVHVTGDSSFYYTPTFADSSSGCSGSTPSVVFATSQFNLYPRAQVIGVYDTTPATPPHQFNSIDGTLTLEPNNVPWSDNDQIEQPHWHTPAISDAQSFVETFTKPLYIDRGKTYAGIVTGNVIGDFVANAGSIASYAGYGGVLSPPQTARTTEGYWGDDEEFASAPNGSLFRVLACKPDVTDLLDANLYLGYDSATTYSAGDMINNNGYIYVALATSKSEPPPPAPTGSDVYWAPYSSCTFWNNSYQLMLLQAANNATQQITFSPLTSQITFFNSKLPCETIFGGNGLSFLNKSGGPCGLTAPYVQSSGPRFTVGGCGNPEVTGGPSSGSFIVPSEVSSCNPIMTMGEGAVASNGWTCWMNDLSTPSNPMRQMIPQGLLQSQAVSGVSSASYSGTLSVTPTGASGTITLSNFTIATGMVATLYVNGGSVGGFDVLTGGYNATTGTGVANTVTYTPGITGVSGAATVTVTASNVAAEFSGGSPSSGDLVNVGCMAY